MLNHGTPLITESLCRIFSLHTHTHVFRARALSLTCTLTKHSRLSTRRQSQHRYVPLDKAVPCRLCPASPCLVLHIRTTHALCPTCPVLTLHTLSCPSLTDGFEVADFFNVEWCIVKCAHACLVCVHGCVGTGDGATQDRRQGV